MEAPLIRFVGTWPEQAQAELRRVIGAVERATETGPAVPFAPWICARHDATKLSLFVAQRMHLHGMAQGFSPGELAEAVRKRWLAAQ